MSTNDPVSNMTPIERIGPYRKSQIVTPHDTNEITPNFRALICGGVAGIATVVGMDGESNLVYLSVGRIVPFHGKIVKSTGTTATTIFAMS